MLMQVTVRITRMCFHDLFLQNFLSFTRKDDWSRTFVYVSIEHSFVIDSLIGTMKCPKQRELDTRFVVLDQAVKFELEKWKVFVNSIEDQDREQANERRKRKNIVDSKTLWTWYVLYFSCTFSLIFAGCFPFYLFQVTRGK